MKDYRGVWRLERSGRRHTPRLDMQNYPHLPLAQVCTTQASDYMALLGGVSA
ncbi:MAG: hypothetical protein P4L10_13170 [Acidobacteriaceae bacterium]|nr:hypothetical protein [Acidobacteriaceae bacterium]